MGKIENYLLGYAEIKQQLECVEAEIERAVPHLAERKKALEEQKRVRAKDIRSRANLINLDKRRMFKVPGAKLVWRHETIGLDESLVAGLLKRNGIDPAELDECRKVTRRAGWRLS